MVLALVVNVNEPVPEPFVVTLKVFALYSSYKTPSIDEPPENLIKLGKVNLIVSVSLGAAE